MFSWPMRRRGCAASCWKRATHVGLSRELVEQDLERDVLPMQRVLGLVDRAHAALAQLGDQAIAAAQDPADRGSLPSSTTSPATVLLPSRGQKCESSG